MAPPRSSSPNPEATLRPVIAGFAIVLVVAALVLALLFAFACLFERRYHARTSGVSDGRFRASGERFVDPETGRVMTVWSDPATGERRYVDEGEPPSPPA